MKKLILFIIITICIIFLNSCGNFMSNSKRVVKVWVIKVYNHENEIIVEKELKSKDSIKGFLIEEKELTVK